MSPKRLRFPVFLALLAGCFTVLALRSPIPNEYLADTPPAGVGSAPSATRAELRANTPAAHAATLALLPDGSIVAYWFAGTREGAGDVRIFGARWAEGRWTDPEATLSVEAVMRDEWRFVRKLGNPVAAVDSKGRLHIFFVSVSVGGWATSNLNQITSVDGGRTWGRARVLVTSPFMNLSTLARTPVVQRSDGGFDLPVYHELARKFPEVLRFGADGHNFQKIRLSAAPRTLQPAIVALSHHEAIALLRDAGPRRQLPVVRTLDGGRSWSPPSDTGLANPDSAVALAQLSDGRLLLAYNPRTDGRSELALATSKDGTDWQRGPTVEMEAGGEFSYPTLLVRSDDDIHLVYTWQRKHIRHLRFNRSWLEQGRSGGRK